MLLLARAEGTRSLRKAHVLDVYCFDGRLVAARVPCKESKCFVFCLLAQLNFTSFRHSVCSEAVYR